MPQFGYSFQNYDKTKHVRASIREKDISHKHSREIALAVKGRSIDKAREFLENVIARKEAVPYRRYNAQCSLFVCFYKHVRQRRRNHPIAPVFWNVD